MLCRLCLYECDQSSAISLFNNGEESNITKLITKYVEIEVTQNDAFSTKICHKCHQHLDEFDKFLQIIEKRQYELHNEFLEVKCVLKEGDLKTVLNLEHNEESLLDFKDVIAEVETPIDNLLTQHEFNNEAEYSDRSIDFDMGNRLDSTFSEDDVPLQKLLRKQDNLTVKNKPEKNLINSKIALHSKKKTKRVSAKSKKITVGRKRQLVKKTERCKVNVNVDSESGDSQSESKQKSQGIENVKENNKKREELIAKNMKLKCEICEISMETFHELKVHYRTEHNTRGYVTCCGVRFCRRFKLIDHIQVHLNPNHFKCQHCDKILSSRICLEIHYNNKHAEKSNLKLGCTKCDRRFAHINNLQAHLLSHTEERKFVCEVCSKGFKSAYMLKVHKRQMHEERQLYICDTCGKEYKFKPSFLRHVAEHQNGALGPTEQCELCGKWLMPNGLRRHMDRHNLTDTQCNICGKIVKSKGALIGHIEYAHKKKSVYACTFCDKTFKRSCVLKEHIAMHTGQKLYNCPNCPREFRSRANMYAHNKKVHVEEWRQAQLNRDKGIKTQKQEESLPTREESSHTTKKEENLYSSLC